MTQFNLGCLTNGSQWICSSTFSSHEFLKIPDISEDRDEDPYDIIEKMLWNAEMDGEDREKALKALETLKQQKNDYTS